MGFNQIRKVVLTKPPSYIHHMCCHLRRTARMFEGMGDFLGLGHFDTHFVKNTQKNVPQEKILEFFPLDTVKTTFRMKYLTQRWTQSGPFFQN